MLWPSRNQFCVYLDPTQDSVSIISYFSIDLLIAVHVLRCKMSLLSTGLSAMIEGATKSSDLTIAHYITPSEGAELMTEYLQKLEK